MHFYVFHLDQHEDKVVCDYTIKTTEFLVLRTYFQYRNKNNLTKPRTEHKPLMVYPWC